MNVPMLDPQKSNAPYQDELERVALNVIRSGKYILGTEVETFEKTCAQYLSCEDTIAVSSGTDALILSLMALGIGPGDEVICPSFTFFATASSIVRVGAVPVFVDVYPGCFTINSSEIINAITDKTKAIIPVHLFGQSAEMEAILKIAKEHNLFIIEDACQAIGAEHIRKAGTLGDTGCFSFFPSKNLGGFGDAGLVSTNNKDLAKELRSLRVHGSSKQYYHDKIGGNFRIDALQATLLNVKIKYLPEAEVKRIEHADLYFEHLQNVKTFMLPPKVRGHHTFNQFTIRVVDDRRDSLQVFLKDKGITSAIYYPLPLHQQKCFEHLVPRDLFLSETEKLSKEVLSLPIASELSNDQIMYVINSLLEFDKSER